MMKKVRSKMFSTLSCHMIINLSHSVNIFTNNISNCTREGIKIGIFMTLKLDKIWNNSFVFVFTSYNFPEFCNSRVSWLPWYIRCFYFAWINFMWCIHYIYQMEDQYTHRFPWLYYGFWYPWKQLTIAMSIHWITKVIKCATWRHSARSF